MTEKNHISKFSKKLLEWYVFGSFHMALVTGLYVVFFYNISHQETDWKYVLFVVLGTHFIYSLHRIVGFLKNENLKSDRYSITTKYIKHVVFYTLMSTLGMLILLFYLSRLQIIKLAVGGLVSFFYVVPFMKDKKRLRDISFIKIFLISLCFAWLCTYIPLQNVYGNAYNMLLFFISFFLLLGLTLPFDIRDVHVDLDGEVQTIASSIGENKTKIVSASVLAMGFFLVLIAYYFGIFGIEAAVSLTLTLGISYFMMREASPNKNEMYFSLWMDGILALPFAFYWIYSLLENFFTSFI